LNSAEKDDNNANMLIELFLLIM